MPVKLYRMIGLPYGEKTMTIMLSRFHLISERYWRTDRRTDLLYQYRASVCWRAINTRNTFRRTLSLSNATFLYFWSRDVHPVQNLLLCTKFHENRIIFRWDMAICRFSKWRLSAILELFTTIRNHPRSLCCWPQTSLRLLSYQLQKSVEGFDL